MSTEAYLDARDSEYAESLPAEERDVVVTTVVRFRRPDRLQVGDPLPDLELRQLDSGRVALRSLAQDQPLVLVFGSFT